MIKQIILYLILFNVCLVISPAQEVVTGLQSNYAITKAWDKQGRHKVKGASDTLELPFFDDFAKQSVFPDSTKWLDDNVFINNTYSDQQITTGIATFDALDNSGRLYETASSSGFMADKLTSKPVNLNYTSSDNIWLSFYFLAGGLGDPPEENDSLTLQFLAPEENTWYPIWKVRGDTVQKFKLVMISIDQARFLKKGFQFRFINYASLSPNLSDPSMVGNCDIWNIDYVFLDKNRNASDTVFRDVAFKYPVRSLLKNYEAMPWKQFREIELQEMRSTVPMHIRNNDTANINKRNVTRNLKIWDIYENSQSNFFIDSAVNINPLTDTVFNPHLIYTFNTVSTDSAMFRITCSLKTDPYDPKENDTVIYYQVFNDYFAFDDGSSEAGYGINGLGSRNAMVAYRFKSYIQDTLRAIRICFNDSYMNANKRRFDLMVWDDKNGMPGKVLYTREECMVEQGKSINDFYVYPVNEGVMVNNTFYIGWKQRTETFLNAGYDINTPHSGKQFYWLNGSWQQSQMPGSIMIRPVVGPPLKTTSIDDTYYTKNEKLIRIWPNPATGIINIDPGENQLYGSSYITIIDIYGRVLIKSIFKEQIDVSSLKEGIYIISITGKDGRFVGYNRIIKTR